MGACGQYNPPMHSYGVREVEKLLRLPRSTIRAFVDAGFVAPERGPRNVWRFSFQDLIVLRTAQSLSAAKVPQRRIVKSVKDLRRHLPDTMPLSGLSICAVADQVVVREGGRKWEADSGQYLLGFELDPKSGSLSVIEETPPRAAPSDGDWFARATALESHDRAAAREAYTRAIAAEPARVEPRLNLGRLLHEDGVLAEAEHVYREALARCGEHALVRFNLAVLLEDLERPRDALQSYAQALALDPSLADAHYNLSLLYEQLAKPRDAIRHMAQYRKLAGGD